MSNLTHPKFHRHNHHTRPSQSGMFPDAAYDPIASPEKPFLGDFVCVDKIVATDPTVAVNLQNKTNAINIKSGQYSISAIGNATFNNGISAYSLSFSDKNLIQADIITTEQQKGTFWVVYLSGEPYGIRLWNTKPTLDDKPSRGIKPYFISHSKNTTIHLDEHVTLKADVRGSHPFEITWIRDGFLLERGDLEYILDTNLSGTYYCVASNNYGTVSSSPIKVDIDAVLPKFVYQSSSISLSSRDIGTQLSALATGTRPITYKWYRNKFGISLSNVTHLDVKLDGEYIVVAQNYVGSVTSTPMTVRYVTISAETLLAKDQTQNDPYILGNFNDLIVIKDV